MRKILKREDVKACYDKVIKDYGNKGDNFILQVIKEELGRYDAGYAHCDKDELREILHDLSVKGEI